ncbi:MAG: hypothetical protein KJ592_00165 [Nanoarchaeota archaeon]|nr:hypothetical protein [Nanoarchaeota archaeon]
MKCELCNEEIKTTFLDKLDGTLIKTSEGETSKKHYMPFLDLVTRRCSTYQKAHKEKLKEKLSE